MKTNIAILLCLLLTFSLSAQKDPVKWGKVAPADLKMKTYDLDPEAEAIVLADYASLRFDFTSNDLLYILDHHVRIKILKKSAFERGDISIPYYSYNNVEKLSGLKAQVILPNGKKIKVDKKDIFDDEYNKYWSRRKFAFPGLEEGCIIEYKYSKKSQSIYYLEDWYFQTDIPTRLSEFRTNIPEWFDYVSFKQGLRHKTEKSELSERIPVSRQRSSRNHNGFSSEGSNLTDNGVQAVIVKTRYYLENVPALKSEKFITTMNDYYSKLSLQLQSVQYPNSPRRDVTSSWSQEAKDLENSATFGGQINKKRYTKKLMAAVQPLLAGIEDDHKKVATIYSFLSQNITWNNLYGRNSHSLDEAFEKKTASSGELNLMFIAICRQSGIKSFPVLASTRTHGKTMQYYPKSDQFDHVLAFVQIGETEQLFDIGSPNRNPNLLRMNSLNYTGWLIDGEKSKWIPIPASKDTEIAMATFTLEDNGNLSGTVSQSFKGYCAMKARTSFHKNKNEDHKHIRENWQEKFPDVNIKSIHFKNENRPNENLNCNIELDIPQAAQLSDEFIYLSPLLGMGLEENPLKQEERTFSVDIPIKSKEQYILNLTIPDGYTVDELPEAISLKMDGDGGSFLFQISQSKNTIQIVSKMIIKKLHYEPEEYDIIKHFFDIIVEKHSEQIVLKKS
jgi:hypothetical protein